MRCMTKYIARYSKLYDEYYITEISGYNRSTFILAGEESFRKFEEEKGIKITEFKEWRDRFYD